MEGRSNNPDPPRTPRSKRASLAILVASLVVLVVACLGLAWPRLAVESVQLHTDEAARVDVVLPHVIRGQDPRNVTYRLRLDLRSPSGLLWVRPRGCVVGLRLNGRPLTMAPRVVDGGCAHRSSFAFSPGRAKDGKPLRVDIAVSADGGTELGVDVRELPGGTQLLPLLAAAVLGLAGVLVCSQQLLAGWGERAWAPWAAALGLVALLAAYFLLAPPSPFDFAEVTTPYHRLLAESLLQGTVALQPGPDAYDLCVHEGRAVLCWGMMPAVLMMPAAWLWEGAPTGRAAGVGVGLVTMISWFLLLHGLRRRGVVALGWLDLVLLSGFVVFGTQLYFLSSSGEVWHLAQSFAVMLGSLAFLLLCRRGMGAAVLASALFGAAALSRFSLMLLFPVFGCMNLLAHLEGVRRWRQLWGRGVLLALPLVGALGVQLLYNRARYGGLLDFGWRYQQGSDALIHDMITSGTLSLAYLPRNLDAYLLDPLSFSATYPHMLSSGRGNALWSHQLAVFVLLAALLVGQPRLPALVRGARARIARVLAARSQPAERLAAVAELPLASVLLWGSAIAWLSYLAFLLLLFTTGARTVGCRLLANALPFFMVMVAFALAQLRTRLLLRVAAWALLMGSVVIHAWIKLSTI